MRESRTEPDHNIGDTGHGVHSAVYQSRIRLRAYADGTRLTKGISGIQENAKQVDNMSGAFSYEKLLHEANNFGI